MTIDYPVIIKPNYYEDSSIEWVASYPDLPGVIGVGDDPEEALKTAEEAKDVFLQYLLDEKKTASQV